MLAVVALSSHLLAAALYGALALFQLRRWSGDSANRPLVGAFAVMSVWSIFLALLDSHAVVTQLAESARNLAFLAFLYGLLHQADGPQQHAVKSVFGAVAAVVGLQIVVGGVIAEYQDVPVVFEALRATGQILGLTIAAGALILVHNLYGQAAPASRGALRFPMVALAALWAYELNLYTVAYFTHGDAPALIALRGVLLACLAPVFALGLRGSPIWKVQISRAATFQSLSLIAILAYLLAMMSASRTMEITGSDWSLAAQLGLVAAMTAAALVLLVSSTARGKLRVLVAKHMFEHRYDYRAEWLRFSDTIGQHGGETAPLEERIVKALADIGGAPGGVLLLTDSPGRLIVAARWNSRLDLPASGEGVEALLRFLAAEAFVLDCTELRAGRLLARDHEILVPSWLAAAEGAWAGIPLIHGGALVGLVLLEHPPFRGALDWEDYDLFRAAGIQAASYLAEARTQQTLADSRRFDEFNRRFAFILHDIKNLVSQLALVAHNAERHADNPDFRADMIATLQS
jgi:putative PEP-CTERM system histidine kinase